MRMKKAGETNEGALKVSQILGALHVTRDAAFVEQDSLNSDGKGCLVEVFRPASWRL